MDEYDFIIARDIELRKRLVHQANILYTTQYIQNQAPIWFKKNKKQNDLKFDF